MSEEDLVCRLCGIGRYVENYTDTRTLRYRCSACGPYSITMEAVAALRGEPVLSFKLGAWVSQAPLDGDGPLVNEGVVTWMRSQPYPTVAKRAEFYLGAVIELLDGKISGRFDPDHQRLRVFSWSFDKLDCRALASFWKDKGAFRIPVTGGGSEMLLTAQAHMMFEELAGARASSSQAFVAMWFNEEMRTAYEQGFREAIVGAGYEPLRVDRTEHDGKIDDKIIAEIRRSAFVVADFTSHRGGVYYEAGFAHGLGRRVIFTCREDDLEALHFDVRQYNTLTWTSSGELAVKLQNRILALFGAGPARPAARAV